MYSLIQLAFTEDPACFNLRLLQWSPAYDKISDSSILLTPGSWKTPGKRLHSTGKMKKLKSRRGFEAWRGSGKKKKETVGEMLSRPKIEMLSRGNRFQSANLKSHITLSWCESVRLFFFHIRPGISTAPYTGTTSQWSPSAGCLFPPEHEGTEIEWQWVGWGCEQFQEPPEPLSQLLADPQGMFTSNLWEVIPPFSKA